MRRQETERDVKKRKEEGEKRRNNEESLRREIAEGWGKNKRGEKRNNNGKLQLTNSSK